MGLISSIKKVVSKITGQDNNKSGSSNTTTHTEIKYSTPPWNAPKSQPSTPVKQDSSTLKQGNGPVNTINEVAKQAVTLPKNTSTSGSRKSGNAVGSGNTDKWSRMSESQQQEQKAVSKQEHAQYEAKQQNQETKTERSARFRSSSPGSFGATEPGSRFESFKRFPTLGEVKKREEEKNPQPQPGAAPQVPEPSVPPVVPDLNRYPGNTTVRNSGKGVLSEAVTKADKDPFNTELSAYAVARDPQILYENDNWDFYNDFKNNQAKNKTFNYFGAQMDAQKHTTPGIFGKGTQFEEGYVPDNPHFYGYNYEPQTHEANEYKEEAKPYIAAGLIVPGLFNSDEPRIVKREYSRSAHGGVMYDTVIYTDEKGKKIELIRGSAHEDEYNTRFLSSFMTESEQSAYYYLRGRYGEDRSDEYIKQLSKALETRALDADTAERYYDIGKNDPIVARITSLLGGYAKIADFVQAGYKDFTNQTPEHSDYNVTTALNALEAGENEGHGAIYRFINGAVNGALENAGFAPLELIPGIGHGAAIAANFAAAAGEKYGEMISSGTFNKSGSTANMITYGVINAVEYGLLGKAFSTPLSQLAKIGPQTAVKSTIVNSANLILSNLGIGATQSFLSSIADTALMGDNSTYNQLIRKYRDEGKTEADAREQAVKDIASGIGQAALAAGLIGTVFGIKNIANEGISFNVRGAALEQSGKTIYDVLNDANATGANSAARKNAAKIRAGLDNGSITPDMYREVMGAQDILNQIDIARQDTYRQRMQELTGLKIGEGQVDERVNGAYRDGVVAVSPTAQIPREEVITHEGQHAAGTKEYHDAVQSIEGFQNAVERVINNYKDQGMTISRKVAEDEVASMVAQNFTQNVKDVERLIRYAEGNPKVADKIYNGLRDLRARVYAKGGRVVYDEKTGLKIDYDELRNLEKLWENAITTVRERGYNNVEGELRYSFAGERAKAADSEALTKAKRMECDGASPEEIWRETGWGKGLDGKWRFEIGNSGAEFNKQGFTENPDILRKRELTDKFLNAAISDEEMQELQSLNSATSGVRKPTKLSDYFKNKELFEAYPELGDIPVKFEKLEKGTHGSYNPGTNSITLNSFDSAAQNKQTLIHEIQHAIQNYEGFAGGSSPSTAVSMDAYRNTAGEIEARDAASRIDMTAEDRRTSFPESMKPNDNVVFSLKRSGGADEKNSNIYDYTKSFEEQIDDWKQGKIPKYDTLLVGGTPEVLKKIGFNALPVTINQTHIDYALNNTRDADHSLGESVLKQLPDKIKNPIAVISSKTHPDTSVVVLLDFQHNGKTVVAPVEIDGYGRQNNLRIDSNAVKSIYAKDNAITKQLSNAIKEYSDSGAGVYYINTKKAAALLQRAGLQLPGGLFLNNGYTDSIAYTGLKVNAKLKNNTYSQQFKRWFGDWEKSPNTASKVVNDDGTPKVVYHGTSRGGFTEFDTYFYLSKYGLFGNGAYFTESHSIADAYTHKGKGENPQIYEAYLNIKNPIDMDAAADVSLWNKALENADYFERAEPGDTNEQVFRKIEEELADNYIPTYEGEEFVRYLLEAMGYDGITHIGGGRVNSDSEKHRVWIAFKPEQIKSATDNIGTFDSSNPDIRYSAKKISDTSKWGTNIDRDVTEFASGLGMNKTIWKRAGKTDVKELIRDAYRLYDENNNTEAQAKLRDAGSMIADSIKLKRGQIIDVNSRTNIINNFVAEFEKNYQQGKTNLIMREARPQDTSDRQNYGIGVNKYVRDVMRSIGVEPNQINEAEEKAVREAFENLKTGDEESARNALDAVARDIYSRARAELLPNERAFMDAVRDSSLDLSSYTDTGELADGDLERLRQITGGSKNGRSTVRSAPDQAYKELSSLFPEFLPPDAGGDPARNILDAYNRIEEKISEPRYGLNDIIAGAENFKDKVITDYRYAQPAAKNTAVEQKNYDTEKYGSDIEASFRDIMSDVTEGEVKRSSQIVRKTLDGIIDGDEIWDDPLSAYDELARNIDETVQQITRGRNRSTDEKQRLAIQIMQSVCDNADSALALAKERTRDQQIKAAIEGNQEKFNQYRERFEKLYKNGNNVHEATSRIYSNTGQKSWLTPETKAEMERNIHSFKYNRQTNMDSYNQAKERLENSHPDDLFNELATTPEWSAVDTMTTQLVVTYYQSTGNVTKAVQLMEIARDKATRAGQMNQAWAFANRLTPAGKLKAWERERTRNIESQIRKKYPGQADALIEEYHDAIEKQEAAQQRLREELYDNNEDYRKTKDEITSKETDVLGRQRSLSEAQNAYNEVQSERVEIEQRVSETQRIIDYGKATADASKKLIEATDELQLLQQQMKDIQMSRRKYKATQERIHSLQEQIDDCKTDLTELDEKIGNAETRIEKLNKTAESRRFERDEIQKRLEAANKEVAELEKRQTELNKQLKALQHGETEAAERALVADSNLEKLKKEIRKLQNNLSHIEKMHRDGASEQDMIDYLDDFFDRLGIDHIGEADLSDYRDAFLMIEEMNTPESLADIILRQSEQRHTARGPVTKKILEGMIKDTSEENIELMKSIATQQLFGMIADTEKASVGRVMSTVLAINQLMNPRTAIRNVLSNMAFSGVEGLITHNVAALLDWGIVQHITGERSISFENPFKGYKTAVNRAKMAYLEQGLNVDIIDRNPTAVSPTKKRTFKRGLGSALEHALGYELTVTDEFAKGVTEGRLRDGLTKIGYTEDEANEIIKEEVLYRTFQDETLPARALQRAKEALNVFGIGNINEHGVHDFGLGNLITNYTIVPGNIFMRSIEYSPVGALKIVQDIYQIGRGLYGRSKIDSPEAKAQSRRVFVRENQRKLLLDITRPLTGGALIWAGYMLKKRGVIVNAHSDEDDYNLNKYDTAKGLGDMQINASALMRMFKKINPDGADTIESAFDGTEPQQGDKLVDLGWMQPVNTGLAIGARIAEATGGTGYHLFSGDGFEQLMTATAGSAYESVQDLAMWSGINNIVTNLKYTDGAGEFVFAESADLALSFLPSVLNQAGNIIDTETRYPYKADGVFELAKWKLYSKLPYMPLREKVPERINLWGEKQSSTLGSTWLDALNSMVFPGSVSKYKKNPMTDELDRLAALDSSVLPKTPYNNNNVKVDGQSYSFSLKGHEYEDFAQMLGQETYKNMILFMNSEDYKLLSDTQRTEELSTISTETNKAVQTAYAMLQLGKSESDIQETLDEHKEEYRQAAANYVLVRQAINYIQSPGVNVEDAGVSAYTFRSYTEEETKEAIKKNNSYIAKVKAGTYYRYDTGSDGKQHRVYSRNWTAEERQKKIDEFTADNEKLANGSKTKKEYITGQWADLTTEQREQLLKNIAKYPDEITLPDSVKANKPDMSGEGYEDNTSVPAELPSPTGPFFRSLTELFGNPDFSIDDPDTYNIDGGKAAQPKAGGMLSGTDTQTLTAYGGSGRSSKWRYNNYNKSGRKYYYKSSKSYSRSYSRNYSRSYAKNNSSRTFSRSRSGNGTRRTYTASAASGRFSSRNSENRFGRYNSGSGTRRFSSRFRNTTQA